MERFCGELQPAIKSRRFPFACIDRYLVSAARLTQLMVRYNLVEELSMRSRPHKKGTLEFSLEACKAVGVFPICFRAHDTTPDDTCVLLPPRKKEPLAPGLLTAVVAALATRFNITDMALMRSLIPANQIMQWGKVRRTDGGGGDTMNASSTATCGEDSRDASFV
jgi:hypothetical protein